jgi:hypothetical protein
MLWRILPATMRTLLPESIFRLGTLVFKLFSVVHTDGSRSMEGGVYKAEYERGVRCLMLPDIYCFGLDGRHNYVHRK